jgi:hypothetical protein
MAQTKTFFGTFFIENYTFLSHAKSDIRFKYFNILCSREQAVPESQFYPEPEPHKTDAALQR